MTDLPAPRRTSRSLVRWALAAVLATGSATIIVAEPATATATKPDRPLISIGHFRHSFSPNGDGFHDRLRIPFALGEDASIHVRVANVATGHVVVDGLLSHDRGLCCGFDAGRHVIKGMDLVPLHSGWRPGRYRLTLVAHVDGSVETGRARTSVDFYPEGIVPAPGVAEADNGAGLVFSPNGDGVQDRARIRFWLERRSRVTALLRPRNGVGATPRVVRLGVRSPGANRWVWDGRAGRKRVPDHDYQVTLRATPVARPSRSPSEGTTRVTVDTKAPDPRIRMSRSTVYPASTAFVDSIRIGLGLTTDQVEQVEVRTVRGGLVARPEPAAHACIWNDGSGANGACTLLTWDARTDAGAVPAGEYVLRMILADHAGNTRTVRRDLTVSAAQLVEHTASVTWAGLAAPEAADYCQGNVCGELEVAHPHCPVSASERFPDGVSYRSDPTTCDGDGATALDEYGATPEVTAGTTPYDRYRITATGGPTTPGAADTASLTAAGDDTAGERSTVWLSGDSTASTGWVSVRPDTELFADVPANARMRWAAGAPRGSRYDIASFTLEYTYWAPAS